MRGHTKGSMSCFVSIVNGWIQVYDSMFVDSVVGAVTFGDVDGDLVGFGKVGVGEEVHVGVVAAAAFFDVVAIATVAVVGAGRGWVIDIFIR